MLVNVKNKLRYLWDTEWEIGEKASFFWPIVIFVALGYTTLELFFRVGNPNPPLGFDELVLMLRGNLSVDAPLLVKTYFPYLWIGVVASCFIFRVYFIVSSYAASLQMFNRRKLHTEMAMYVISAVIVMISTFVLFRLLGFVTWLLGMGFHTGVESMDALTHYLSQLIDTHIPTIVHLPYPLALLFLILGFNVSSLAGYFIHWLTHQSRFLWLTVHRPHHMPEILHPIGVPLAFNFGFLLAIPHVLFSVFFAKLFYEGSLLMETTLVLIFYYHFEIFNHLSTHYHMAYHNKLVRFFSDITGSGIYHYMHHTSEEGKETVNLGGGFFMLWDRLFRTFEQPPALPPRTGLTNNPVFVRNPFRVTFSGFAQIWYEMKHNKHWKTRWLILFGDVYYKPPVTKEYLILGYQ